MPSNSAEPPVSPVVPRVATFFALYPDPLGLADGTYYCVTKRSPVRGFPSKIILHVKEGEPPVYLDPRMHEWLFVSVRFHRGTREQDFFAEHMSQLLRVVERVGGSHFRAPAPEAPSADVDGEESSALADAESVYTVVEMTTPIVQAQGSHWEPCMPTDDVMGPTLTRCLMELMRVISAYRSAEKILIPSPARERVGPVIISATRPANPDEGGWDPEIHNVINFFATYRQPVLRGDHKPTTMTAMAEYVFYESIGHPSLALGSVQNEMDVALYHDGNFRSAVMSAHSASEVLLDAALMGMLFEESRDPETAVSAFDKPLKSRLLIEFPERLGGAWSPQGSNTVAVWIRDLLTLRHRVAHAGYMPSSEEATAAREAYYALGRHLRDRLTVRVKKYPFTAGLLVTRAGFERRNVQTKATAEAVKSVSVEALTAFASWRADLIRLRTGAL